MCLKTKYRCRGYKSRSNMKIISIFKTIGRTNRSFIRGLMPSWSDSHAEAEERCTVWHSIFAEHWQHILKSKVLSKQQWLNQWALQLYLSGLICKTLCRFWLCEFDILPHEALSTTHSHKGQFILGMKDFLKILSDFVLLWVNTYVL